MAKRDPIRFHRAYCDGKIGTEGYWEADGRSDRADDELVKRLGLVMIKRERDVIWKDTPPKTRHMVYVDVGIKDDVNTLVKRLTNETHLFKALERTLEYKTDTICEKVIEECLSREKAIIWVLTRESVEIMTSAFEKACDNREVRSALRNAKLRIWATHGEADVKARFDIAAQFRNHQGAGVIIATMDSLPESISLFGASTEHYAQLHFLSGPMEQSENRPYLKGTSKLAIYYYIAKETVDERMVNIVIPRLIAAERIGGSKDAGATSLIFGPKKEEGFMDFVARLTRSGPEDAEVDTSADDPVDDPDLDK